MDIDVLLGDAAVSEAVLEENLKDFADGLEEGDGIEAGGVEAVANKGLVGNDNFVLKLIDGFDLGDPVDETDLLDESGVTLGEVDKDALGVVEGAFGVVVGINFD